MENLGIRGLAEICFVCISVFSAQSTWKGLANKRSDCYLWILLGNALVSRRLNVIYTFVQTQNSEFTSVQQEHVSDLSDRLMSCCYKLWTFFSVFLCPHWQILLVSPQPWISESYFDTCTGYRVHSAGARFPWLSPFLQIVCWHTISCTRWQCRLCFKYLVITCSEYPKQTFIFLHFVFCLSASNPEAIPVLMFEVNISPAFKRGGLLWLTTLWKLIPEHTNSKHQPFIITPWKHCFQLKDQCVDLI